ncbi:hypothetical protein LLE49_14470 [Alicyclobacillus tolerans]|uniref:hypothetical protein n=1 Tax=Alicyclobacillus tolerans TaxID=90970 RepID=UPI001F3324FF|nr:hypothetical protein [Alicyclobacillus tolerans]MCF8565927.1 hypothetical protein [Alicyclobacillus tolerans]
MMKAKLGKLGIAAGIGTAVIAVGAMTLPAFAATTPNSNESWLAKMQSFMSQTFTPQQRQQFMSSSAMQELHNSSAMQRDMQQHDFGKMESLMNSDQQLKQQIGAENVAKMNQMMGQLQGLYQSGK